MFCVDIDIVELLSLIYLIMKLKMQMIDLSTIQNKLLEL